ncbi:TPA: hypothetical protein ACX6SF_002817 [Photobacterium damselae]
MLGKIIATSFYYSDNTSFVNCKSKSFDLYHKCIYQMFKSLRYKTKNVQLILFSNIQPPEDFVSKLISINVKIIVIDSNIAKNTKLKNNFPGCLFLLDAIHHCSKKQLGDILFLDSDIYVNYFNEEFVFFNKIGFYDIKYDINKNVNGRSIKKMSEDLKIVKNISSCVRYCGGEYFFIPKSKLDKVSNEIDVWYDYYNNKSATITEEHILSLVVASLYNESKSISDENIIKRIWNTYNYNNISGDEKKYMLLHMPAEKERGFIITNHQLEKGIYNNISNFNLVSNRIGYMMKRIMQNVINFLSK